MEREIRRPTPSNKVRFIRTENLFSRLERGYNRELPEPGFEPGNKKTGSAGGNYENVMVWNTPALSTCPGASAWCKSVCYNGDDRPDVLLEDQWQSNLKGFESDSNQLSESLQAAIDDSEHPLAIRIHSSGDFFSKEYIEFWNSLISNNPSVTFWGYTRSWTIPELEESLNTLRSNENLQLFASWDATMPEPPQGWRISYVNDPEYPAEIPENVTRCPEEFIDGMNCAKCGFCLRKIGRGVLFNVH